jgi:hypothetical protein
MTRRAPILCLLAALAAATGCKEERIEPARVNYYLDSYGKVRKIQRVVFIELDEDIRYPGMARNMTSELVRSVQDKGLFHIQVRNRHEPICRDLGLEKPRRYSLDEMARIRKELNCDGVLFGRLVEMDFFPRTKLSLYLALVDLRRGKIAWCVDNTWDASDSSIRKRIHQFIRRRKEGPYAPNPAEIAAVSPRNFQKFVAYEAAKTLAPRPNRFGQLVKYKQRLELYDFLEENW